MINVNKFDRQMSESSKIRRVISDSRTTPAASSQVKSMTKAKKKGNASAASFKGKAEEQRFEKRFADSLGKAMASGAGKKKGGGRKAKAARSTRQTRDGTVTAPVAVGYTRTSRIERTQRVQGSDFLGNVNSSTTQGATLFNFKFNPATLTGSRLLLESGLWEKWKVNGLKVEFRPSCATTREGSYIAYLDYDVADDPSLITGVNSVRNALSHQGSVEASHFVPINVAGTEAKRLQQKLYCNPANHVDDLAYYCRVIAVQNVPSTVTTAFGSVHLHWDITFSDAVNESSLVQPQYCGAIWGASGTYGWTLTGFNPVAQNTIPMAYFTSTTPPTYNLNRCEVWQSATDLPTLYLRVNKPGWYKWSVTWGPGTGPYDPNTGAITLTSGTGLAGVATTWVSYDSTARIKQISGVFSTTGDQTAYLGVICAGGASGTSGYMGLELVAVPIGISSITTTQAVKASRPTTQEEMKEKPVEPIVAKVKTTETQPAAAAAAVSVRSKSTPREPRFVFVEQEES